MFLVWVVADCIEKGNNWIKSRYFEAIKIIQLSRNDQKICLHFYALSLTSWLMEWWKSSFVKNKCDFLWGPSRFSPIFIEKEVKCTIQNFFRAIGYPKSKRISCELSKLCRVSVIFHGVLLGKNGWDKKNTPRSISWGKFREVAL